MQARYINELTEGSRVDSVFVIRAKELRTARTGESYLALDVSDRSGSLPAILFRPTREAVEVPAGAVVRLSGTVTSFRGTRRISVETMTAAEKWDAKDLLATGSRQTAEMVAELKRLVASVQHPGLRSLLRAVFSDKRFFGRFCECPGSQSYHHPYIGGLLEHTVSVAAHCAVVAPRYDGMDQDMLVAAALVHDIGKVDELTWGPGIGYSDAGRFVGHVVLGVQRIHAAAERVSIAEETLLKLEHAVLSHHGELEWGSPKRPSTAEALLLHHVDNLDAKTAGFTEALAGATLADEAWTDSANLFRRPLFAPRPVEDDRPHRAEEDAQHFQLTA